jgi:hypothetical protein
MAEKIRALVVANLAVSNRLFQKFTTLLSLQSLFLNWMATLNKAVCLLLVATVALSQQGTPNEYPFIHSTTSVQRGLSFLSSIYHTHLKFIVDFYDELVTV